MTPNRAMTIFWRFYAALVLAALICWSTHNMPQIPDPLIEPADELVPVTIGLNPTQALRLEIILARMGERHPGADTNQMVDAIFEQGLQVAERESGQ